MRPPPLLLAACASLPAWLNHLHVVFFDVSISGFLNSYGYLAVFLFIGIENLGVPFPGETMLVAASVFAAQGCGLQEPGVIVACIAGSTVGSTAGFYVGRTGGRGLIRKLHISDKHLAPAEAYFRRYGGATVFFGRFLAILRAWAAFLAGVNNMNPIRFFLYNLSGAVLWSTSFGLLGYLLGKNLARLRSVVQTLGLIGAVVAAALIAVLIGLLLLRRRRAQSAGRVHDHALGDPDGGQDPRQAPSASPPHPTRPEAEGPTSPLPDAPLGTGEQALSAAPATPDGQPLPPSHLAAEEPALQQVPLASQLPDQLEEEQPVPPARPADLQTPPPVWPEELQTLPSPARPEEERTPPPAAPSPARRAEDQAPSSEPSPVRPPHGCTPHLCS